MGGPQALRSGPALVSGAGFLVSPHQQDQRFRVVLVFFELRNSFLEVALRGQHFSGGAVPAFLDYAIAIAGRQLSKPVDGGLRSVGFASLEQPRCPQPADARHLLVAVGRRQVLAMSQSVFSRSQALDSLLIVNRILRHATKSLRFL